MGASLAVKPYLRRRAAARGGAPVETFAMKTLATLPLAARQKAMLLQVGDERILVGVTAESVTFLTAIGKSQGAGASGYARAVAAPALASAVGNDPRFERLLAERAAPAGEVTLRQPAAPANRPAPWDQPPVLKAMEGNDVESLSPRRTQPAAAPTTAANADAPARDAAQAQAPRRRVPSPHGAPVKAPKKVSGDPEADVAAAPRPASRINVAVGEDGIKDLSPRTKAKTKEPAASGQSIDDVTRLIREKLKTLRTI
jgi:hypothetical protein